MDSLLRRLPNFPNKCTTKQLIFGNLTHVILTLENQLCTHVTTLQTVWQIHKFGRSRPQINGIRLYWWRLCILHTHVTLIRVWRYEYKMIWRRFTRHKKNEGLQYVYLPMKALDNVWGRAREINLEVVGLALIARNLTIWAELTKPYMSKITVKFLFIHASYLKKIREGLTIS